MSGWCTCGGLRSGKDVFAARSHEHDVAIGEHGRVDDAGRSGDPQAVRLAIGVEIPDARSGDPALDLEGGRGDVLGGIQAARVQRDAGRRHDMAGEEIDQVEAM